MVHIWYEDDGGWIHRNNGRFYLRRNPAHITRVLELKRRLWDAEAEVRVAGNRQ